ncbi:MAG: hypothetical protein H0X37_07855 [Herpetosiphonaceae bacterium]|nr:hypothetical protein [Herpetosiphonaceae bacterium]
MMSVSALLSNQRRACSRLFVCLPGHPMHLALPFHPEWTGGRTTATALADLQATGVTALELNLPPALGAADSELWHTIVKLTRPDFILHLHAPLPPASPGWPLVRELLRELAASQGAPPFLVVHAPPTTGGTGNSDDVHRWLARLLHTLPEGAQLALELGWDWGASTRLAARWRRWRQQATKRSGIDGRPQGVGSGLGATVPQPALPRLGKGGPLDPSLAINGWASSLRGASFSAAGTRAATLALVNAVGDPRLRIAWDLAHDWLGGPWSGEHGWTTVPDREFLKSVSYVRLHDVADDGTDHLPLVVGNVPYTTQLRSLLRTPFDGPVCVAMRHTGAAARLGSRAELQATSLAVARHVLRIS